MSVALDQLPAKAVAACVRVRDEFLEALKGDLVALWAYGAVVFPEPPQLLGDVDLFAVLERPPGPAASLRLGATRAFVEQDLDVALDIDVVLAADAARSEIPWKLTIDDPRIVDWAFLRAHWLAGHYVLLHGPGPEAIVPAPTWPELEEAIRFEVAHLEAHVAAGEDDRYECSYAMLNGSRLLYTIQARDAAISKRAAGAWALEHLPTRWHDAIRAAGHVYDRLPTGEEDDVLRAAMAPFVEMVAERVRAVM